MAFRINVQYKVSDTRALVARHTFQGLGLKSKISNISIVDLYTVDATVSAKNERVVAALFVNPLVESATSNGINAPNNFSWVIEIGYLPGVTDNVGGTAKETIEDFLKKKFKEGEAVYSSQIFFVSGKVSEKDVRTIADSLYNPLIQRARIKTSVQFKKEGMGIVIPKVELHTIPKADIVNVEINDEELTKIGEEGIANKDGTRRGSLTLDLPSLHAVRDYFRKKGRAPTDVELETLAQTWSEHCKHTIFASSIDDVPQGLYRTYIKGATNEIRKRKGKKDFCVSVFKDNSGAIVFDENYLITHKVETHNSPSALDPFGGAITGIVGVNRDAMGFGLGAKPAINLYGFCLSSPDDARVLYRDKEKTQKMLSASRIMEGVIKGVNAGGNCSGIPTPQGFLLFDKRYRGKPLVFAGTVGLIPRKIHEKLSHEKNARKGDYIVMVGGRVGADGIHGATFSSEATHSGSPQGAVQIGDPITQKKMSDALIKEARDKGLYDSITDNGAGGLSSSVAETARDMENGGCLVNLEKVPLKYPGLAPWQIWLSESQERMTLAVPKNKWGQLSTLLTSRGVEATVIGAFTDSGKCIVKHKGKTVMDIDLEFLHEGLPKKQLVTEGPAVVEQEVKEIKDPTAQLKELLQDPNIASFEFVSKQYDHEVQGTSVLKPLQGRGRVNADATVVRPLLNSQRGVVLSSGIAPQYSEIDPYRMAGYVIDTAIRTAVAAGANPNYIALLDNFCWCSSDDPGRLWQLKRAATGCYDYAVAYEAPFISGKDSMFNDFEGFDDSGNPIKISVPPTLLISAIGVIPDVEKSISIDTKLAGDLIYVIADTKKESGVPRVDAEKNKIMYNAFYAAAQKGLIASAISVGRGGVGTALAKMTIAGRLGIDAAFEDELLFNECAGRIIATVAPKNAKSFEKMMQGNIFTRIGKVTSKESIIIRGKQKVELSVAEAERLYKSTFKNY